MSNIKFTGIMPALVSPLDAQGNIIKAGVREIMEYELNMGVDGFYVTGSTGEGPAMTEENCKDMVETAIDYARSRKTLSGNNVNIIVHVASADPYRAFRLAKHAEDAGADAIASLPCNFVEGHSFNELLDYYTRLANCVKLPFLVYSTPALGNVDVKAFIQELMKVDNVIGTKCTIRDYYHMGRLKQINNGDINVLNGPDETLVCGLTMGADGGIGSTYNVLGDRFVKLYNLFKAGKIAEATAEQVKINDIITAMLKFPCHSNVLKTILKAKGLNAGQSVYPVKAMGDEQTKALLAELKKAGYEI